MYSLLAQLGKAKQSLALPLSLAVSSLFALPSAAFAFSFTPLAAAHEIKAETASQVRPAQVKVPSAQVAQSAKPRALLGAEKANVYSGELSLAGITLSSTKEDVLWMLGTPKSQETLSGFVDEVFYFGGISISFAGGYVWDIISTSPKFCTPSGVCPGDSVSYVFNTLGPTDIIGQSAVYSAGACEMDLAISYDAVSQIKLICR